MNYYNDEYTEEDEWYEGGEIKGDLEREEG